MQRSIVSFPGQPKPFHLAVEGNIGAGKSTFLDKVCERLPQRLGVLWAPEPHQVWQDIGGVNLLDLFYKDAPRWAYTFQSYVLMSRLKQQKNISSQALVHITERSLYADFYCFARNCFEQGLMTQLEWHVYEEWFQQFVLPAAVPDAFMYVRVDPEICYARMAKRSRSEESAVPLSYLYQLHEKHENLLVDRLALPSYIVDTPVLILDGNKEFENDPALCAYYARMIEDFLMAYCYKAPIAG